MGQLMMTSQFPDVSGIVTRNMKFYEYQAFKTWVDEFKTIVEVKGTDMRVHQQMRFEGPGTAVVKPEGEVSAQRALAEGWIEQAVQTTYSIELPITFEQRKYAAKDAGFVNQMGQFNARSMKLVKEYDCANILNNGFSTSYIGGDGAAYYSAAHSFKSTGTAYSNLLNAASFGRSPVETAFVTIAQAKMEQNIPASMMPKKITISWNNLFVLPELLKSIKDPDNANNTYNVIQDYSLKPNLNHYLSTGTPYFVDTEVNTRDLIVAEKTKFDSYMENETNNLVERGMTCQATLFHDAMGSFGSQGA